MKRVPLSVVILTKDEELNLEACLASVDHVVDEIFVVDSGSTDTTVEIARRHGAEVVAHDFHGHTAQWKWALANLPLRNTWVLGLDADQRLTPELGEELRRSSARTSASRRQASPAPRVGRRRTRWVRPTWAWRTRAGRR